MISINDVLSGTNVKEIKSVLNKKENEVDCYNFLNGHFCFLPIKYCSEEKELDKNPVKVIGSILHDVDGSKGMKTLYTPEAVIILYELLWNNVLNTKKPIEITKGKKLFSGIVNYFYEMRWKDDITCKVSGDLLNSFPKQKTIEILYPNLHEIPFQLKLFARLCYTLGNFMPVPCLGRAKNSMNSIHSYFKYGEGFLERIDYFLYDIVNYNESKYKESYNKFKWYINDGYIEMNYLNDYIDNNSIFDLATKHDKIKSRGSLEKITNETINTYIENVNARIIARGNRMLEKLKMNYTDKDILIMFTNDWE
ncbi:hypothetical protein R2R35_18685 [Anaerocolumna sp. AGMB13020]|uniref:hypothetical protein n=1 Tax=Anaerocolumna sp. AGMB13020 TaxID=3081750 RepID=UPI002953C74C|nr:hypothetical protein [Anaerocolumna sp. AGMB13020]WOO35808.1 hypothetical protein R2R35_18685 [Anaerocolumna sp. AGMB13020]